MDQLLTVYLARIQAIIDQLYADLNAIPESDDTAAIREAIRRMEDILHQYQK